MLKIFLASILFFSSANAQVRTEKIDILESHSAFKNYIINPSAVKSATAGTAFSSASLTRDTDTNDRIDGAASFLCDTSALNGFCEFDTSTILFPDTNGNCEASIEFKGDASLYSLRLTNGATTLSEATLRNTGTEWAEATINYPCGSSRDIRIVQTSAGTSPAINVGRIFYGRARNLIGVATVFDSLGAVFYVAGSQCPTGSVVADGSAVSRVTFAPLFAQIGTTHGVGDGSTTFNLPDLRGIFVKGSGSQVISSNTYTGTLGAKQTDQMQSHRHGSGVVSDVDWGFNRGVIGASRSTRMAAQANAASQEGLTSSPLDDGNGTPRTGTQTHPANISLTPCIYNISEKSPAINPAVQALQPAGEIMAFSGAVCPVGWLSANGVSLPRSSYPELFARIGTNFGSVDGNSFNIPDLRGQFLRGLITIPNQPATGSASSNNVTVTGHGYQRSGIPVRIFGTPVTGLTTGTTYWLIVVDSNTVAFASSRANALSGTKIAISGSAASMTLAQWMDPDASSRAAAAPGGTSGLSVGSFQEDEFEAHNHGSIPGYQNNVGTSRSNGFYGAGTDFFSLATGTIGGNETRPANTAVNYCIRAQDQSTNAPLLVGSVTSNSSGLERVERVYFGGSTANSACTSTPCTIKTQSGSWVSSVTRSGAGSYIVNINSGIFSAAPVCQATVVVSPAYDATFARFDAEPTTSSLSLRSIRATNTSEDTAIAVTCQGPR